MSATDNDAFSRLWWGIRRFWPVLAIALVLGLTASSSSAVREGLSTTADYEATALVVASVLEIDAEHLGRTADAVFTSGDVAEEVAEELDDVAVGEVIPSHVRLEPVVDTVALRVIGAAPDPGEAADLANVAADALVTALNDIGPGLGVFVLQDPARPPTVRSAQPAVVLPVLLGTIGGLLLGIAAISLLLVMRRPVLSPDEASAITGVEALAVLTVPRRGRAIVPESIGGLALLSRRLYSSAGPAAAAIVGSGGDRALRLEITRLLARLVARRRHVYVLAAEEDRGEALDALAAVDSSVTVVTSWLRDRLRASDVALRMEDGDAPVLFSVSASDYDVPQLLPDDARAALLVAEGAKASTIEAAAKQFVPGDLLGIVFVRRRRLRRDVAARSAA